MKSVVKLLHRATLVSLGSLWVRRGWMGQGKWVQGDDRAVISKSRNSWRKENSEPQISHYLLHPTTP